MAGRITAALEEFWRWWGGELRVLLPRTGLGSRSGHARRLLITAEGPRRALILESRGASERLAEAPAGEGVAVFAGLIAARADLPLGLRLGSAECFARPLQLPAQAEADFRRILDLDMERATPFRSAEVVTAFHIPDGASAPRGMRAVRHLIVKRRTLETLIAEVRALGLEPAFADCWDESGRAGLPIDFLAALRPQAPAAPRFSARRLAVLAAVLGASALAIWALRHQAALAGLTARSEAARSEAAATRLAVEASQTASARIEALSRRLSHRLPAARIIEELTTIIPDHAWVSDLRIDGDVVEFTGYAKSAAALIPLLEAAPLFQEATLTSPVVLDAAEDKERFSVRLRLALPGVGIPAATEEDVAAQEALDP